MQLLSIGRQSMRGPAQVLKYRRFPHTLTGLLIKFIYFKYGLHHTWFSSWQTLHVMQFVCNILL